MEFLNSSPSLKCSSALSVASLMVTTGINQNTANAKLALVSAIRLRFYGYTCKGPRALSKSPITHLSWNCDLHDPNVEGGGKLKERSRSKWISQHPSLWLGNKVSFTWFTPYVNQLLKRLNYVRTHIQILRAPWWLNYFLERKIMFISLLFILQLLPNKNDFSFLFCYK